MFKQLILSILTCLTLTSCLYSAQEAAKTSNGNEEQKKENGLKEEVVITSHQVKIGGKNISYQTTVGTQLLTDCQGNSKASIFYIAYTKDDVTDKRTRPITFCFNGGPGSASVWLHLGTFGPKRVNIDEEGVRATQPFHLNDNPYSLLDVTDLVFIDPVSTGYSRACPVEDAKQFHGVDQDIQSIAEFIRLYVTRNERWTSPKFLAGESYGTTRAAGLALELHDNQHLDLNGVVLISCVLNFQTLSFRSGNDLPYILYLPTYTATALYHNKLAPELQQDKQKTLLEAEQFAYTEYAHALMLGDKISLEQRTATVEKLSRYTGISKDYIDRSDLRLHMFRFAKELLLDQRRTVGRFDGRLKGIDSDLCNDVFEYDPSFENIIGLFTATFNDYVRTDLNWKKDEEYTVLADVQPWDYGDAKNQYLNVSDKLCEVMSKNPLLEVFVASGYTDLATPFFATEYTFAHLGLDPALRSHVTLETYQGGHMMYLYYPSLVKLKEDLARFMKGAVDKSS
ncbi:MAG: peptidase S10 [Parachlamydiaceae bacterium]